MALRALTELLEDPVPNVRVDAAYLLGYSKDGAARGALTAALADDDPRVRLAVCRALGWLGPGQAAEPTLAELCHADLSVDVRIAAEEALGRGDEDAVAAYRLGLGARDKYLREDGESALAR